MCVCVCASIKGEWKEDWFVLFMILSFKMISEEQNTVMIMKR